MSPEDLLIFQRYGIKSYDNVKNPSKIDYLPLDEEIYRPDPDS